MRTLSGGNQQKALLARWHLADAEIFVLIEPTRGVDVGARADIYRRLDALARAGKAIIVVSSDLAGGAGAGRPHPGHARRPIVAETTPAAVDEERAEPDGPGRGARHDAVAGRAATSRRRRRSGEGVLSRHADAGRRRCCCALVFAADRRRSSARPATPPTSCGSRPRSWCLAWRWRRGAGRRHRPVGRLGGARLGDACRHRAGRRTGTPAVAMLDGHRHRRRGRADQRAARSRGFRISPVIVTLGTMIAVRGLSLVAARAFQFLDRDQRRRSSTGSPVRTLSSAAARCRCRRPARRRALAGSSPAHHARPRLGCGRRQRRWRRGSPASGCGGCAAAPMSPAARWPARRASWSPRAPG